MNVKLLNVKAPLLFLPLLFLSAYPLQASTGGGWVSKKGKGYLKIAYRLIQANAFYNDDGDIIDIPSTSLHSASLYAEYGLWKHFEMTASLPVFVYNTQESAGNTESGALSGIGDIDLGLKYGIIQDQPFVLSASISVGLPTGKADEADKRFQTGDGEFNQYLEVQASRSLYPIPLYFSGSLGFNNRTKDFSDEIRFAIEGGLTFAKRWHFKLFLDGLFPLKSNDKVQEADNFYSVFHNKTQYLAYGPQLSMSFYEDTLGVVLGAGFATLGRNILASPSLSLGAYLKF